MAKYDLTNSLETNFTFSIQGKEFDFRKPTVREMRAISEKFSGVSQEEDPEIQLKKSDEAMEEIYKFIHSVNHDSFIGDVMNDQPVGVQIAFNEMIRKELGEGK